MDKIYSSSFRNLYSINRQLFSELKKIDVVNEVLIVEKVEYPAAFFTIFGRAFVFYFIDYEVMRIPYSVFALEFLSQKFDPVKGKLIVHETQEITKFGIGSSEYPDKFYAQFLDNPMMNQDYTTLDFLKGLIQIITYLK